MSTTSTGTPSVSTSSARNEVRPVVPREKKA
jgi:hypothetical protein